MPERKKRAKPRIRRRNKSFDPLGTLDFLRSSGVVSLSPPIDIPNQTVQIEINDEPVTIRNLNGPSFTQMLQEEERGESDLLYNYYLQQRLLEEQQLRGQTLDEEIRQVEDNETF